MIKYLFNKWFSYKGKYFYKNFMKIPRFIGEVHYFLKTGLIYEATYNHDLYITEHILKCLKEYQNNHMGWPPEYENQEDWNKTVDKMIHYLEIMLDDNKPGSMYDVGILYNSAKNRFFELYNKYFNYLWD